MAGPFSFCRPVLGPGGGAWKDKAARRHWCLRLAFGSQSALPFVSGGFGLTIGVFPPVSREVSMKGEKTTPLHRRMIENMHIRGFCARTRQGHIRCVKHFPSFLGRSPDTATPEDLRAYQLQMTKDLVSATTFNLRIISLRFF